MNDSNKKEENNQVCHCPKCCPNISSEEELRMNKRRWTNRRRMAWISFWFVIGLNLYVIFKLDAERVSVVENLVIWLNVFMSAIVGAYIGFATLEGKWDKK